MKALDIIDPISFKRTQEVLQTMIKRFWRVQWVNTCILQRSQWNRPIKASTLGMTLSRIKVRAVNKDWKFWITSLKSKSSYSIRGDSITVEQTTLLLNSSKLSKNRSSMPNHLSNNIRLRPRRCLITKERTLQQAPMWPILLLALSIPTLGWMVDSIERMGKISWQRW